MKRLARYLPPKSMAAAVALSAALLAAGFSSSARATVVSGASSAFDESVNLTLNPLLPGPVVTVTSNSFVESGTAPPAYSFSGSLASLSVPGVLATGLLSANASSNVDGLSGPRSATANATVNGLTIGPLGALFGLTATTIQSTASSSGDFGALSSAGTTTIENLVINGIPFVVVTPAPNAILLNALGVEVIANAQTLTGNGTSTTGITVDALDIILTNALGTINGVTGTINGSIIIDQSESALAAVFGGGGGGGGGGAVPEPPSVLLLAAGILSFLGIYRQRSRGNLAG